MPTRLTPQQREAARLDSTGLSSSEIAARIGIANETLSRWRAQRPYQRAVDRLQTEMDKDTLKAVRTLRGQALKAVRLALTRALQDLGGASPTEAVKVGEFALKIYTATSAQTGRPMQHDVSIHGPGGGPIAIRPAVLDSMPDDQLAAATHALAALVERPDDDFDDDDDPAIIDAEVDEGEE